MVIKSDIYLRKKAYEESLKAINESEELIKKLYPNKDTLLMV